MVFTIDHPPLTPLDHRPPITAVVLTYNKSTYTRLCLEGLCRTPYRPLQIILIDNGSQDDIQSLAAAAAERARETGIDFQFVHNDTNRGAPTARNQGIRLASGEFLLFIDNDAVPFSSHWLDDMALALARLPEAGVVSARMIYPFAPHLVQFAGCGISKSGRVQYIGRGAERSNTEYQGYREVQCLISACILCRADAVKAAGGFDEAFNPVQYEDLDLCYRMRESGWRCYVAGPAEVYHFENTTTDGSTDINFKYVTIKNGLLFKQRWKHRFSEEAGPDDAETAWLKIEQKTLPQMGPLWSPWGDSGGGFSTLLGEKT